MEKWIAGLTGSYKRGVDWWAEHRSAANPGSCRGREATSLEFISGCEAARARLAAVDVKRKSDPEYRRGWNTYNDAPTMQPVTAGPPVPPVDQVDGSDRNGPQLPRNFSSVSSGANSAETGEHTTASFDCRHASTPIERMICANPNLSALDDRMSRLYAEATDTRPSEQLLAEQRAWWAQRNRCGDPACIAELYRRRIAQLEIVRAGAGNP